jgi:hypothetical protein
LISSCLESGDGFVLPDKANTADYEQKMPKVRHEAQYFVWAIVQIIRACATPTAGGLWTASSKLYNFGSQKTLEILVILSGTGKSLSSSNKQNARVELKSLNLKFFRI